MLSVGDSAPSFELSNQDGETVALSDLDRPLVLYFYPKAGTDGCTTEAQHFAQEYENLQSAGIEVVGVSTDAVSDLQEFHEQQNLSFHLLSDADGAVAKAYETFDTPEIEGQQYEIALRKTYVIGEDDTIVTTYDEVSPATHPEQILTDHTE